MARIDLHSFERDLANKPGKGSMAPPRTIRAKDLDDNNKKLTVLPGEGSPPIYTVKYTSDGIILNVLPTPPSSGVLHVLTAANGVLAWTPTQDCP